MSPDDAIGGRMELEGFDTAEIGDRVYVRARLKDPTQKFRLSVDGVLRDDLCLNRTDEKLTLQCVLQNGYGRLYNQSREAVFDGTDGLLQASGRIGYETEHVWESGYSIQEDRWYRPYVLVKSEETFESEGVMTLLAEEECWGWQPSYGLHKAKQYGLDVVIPRIARVYGPTLLKTDTKALSQFIADALAGRDIVLKSEGMQYYSYLHVDDAAGGILFAMLRGGRGEAYNVADGRSDIRLRDLAELIARECGRKVVFDLPTAAEAAGFSTATVARLDPGKIAALGWKADWGIEDGIRQTLRELAGGKRTEAR